MRHLRHWWEIVLFRPFTEWCDDCDDTGIEQYIGNKPWYCWRCKRGQTLRTTEKRRGRIAGLEREALR